MRSRCLLLAAAVALVPNVGADEERPRIYFPRNIKRQFFNTSIASSEPTFLPESTSSEVPTLLPPLLPTTSSEEETLTESDEPLDDGSSTSSPWGRDGEEGSVTTIVIESTIVVTPGQSSSTTGPSSGGLPETILSPTVSTDDSTIVSSSATAPSSTTTEEDEEDEGDEEDDDADELSSTSESEILLAPTGIVTPTSESTKPPSSSPSSSSVPPLSPSSSAPVSPTPSSTRSSTVASSSSSSSIPSPSSSSSSGLLPSLPTSLLPSLPTTLLTQLPTLLPQTSSAPTEVSSEVEDEPTTNTTVPDATPTDTGDGGDDLVTSSSIDETPTTPTTILTTPTDTLPTVVIPTETSSVPTEPTDTPTDTPTEPPTETPTVVPTDPPSTNTNTTVPVPPTDSELPPTETSSLPVDPTEPTGVTDPPTTTSNNGTSSETDLPSGPTSPTLVPVPLPTGNATSSSDSELLPSPTPTDTQAVSETKLTSIAATNTITDSRSWLPTSLVAEVGSMTTSPTEVLAPTATGTLPSGIPRVITPNSENSPDQPADTTKIQIGFLYPFNFRFLIESPVSAAQIFTELPRALGDSAGFDKNDITMISLVPYDTQQTLGYITTLAMMYYPSTFIDQLRMDIKIPNSALYNHDEELLRNLTATINSAIDIMPGSELPVDAIETPEESDPVAGETQEPETTSEEKFKTAGFVMGGVALAGVYGVMMFLVARRYKRKKQAHQRSPSLTGSNTGRFTMGPDSMGRYSSPEMSQGTPPMMGGALLSRDFTSYGAFGGPGGRDSHGSGRSGRSGGNNSGRTAYISAPVAAENSLGWN